MVQHVNRMKTLSDQMQALGHTLHSVAPLNDNNRETEKAAYDTVQRVEE